MGALNEWSKKNSPYIKLKHNESYEGAFESAKVIPDPRDPLKETVRYQIGGKCLDSKSGRLCQIFDDIKPGTQVRLTRQGEGTDTKYLVKELGKTELKSQESELADWDK